jgi:Alw26I/Eco31I/Esp3I family type II restriction m6 adenine DNA methyltransferase
VCLWDTKADGLYRAQDRLGVLQSAGISIQERDVWQGDTFSRFALSGCQQFDVVITNPPWENLKPDSRELQLLPVEARVDYTAAIRATAQHLEREFPHAAASVKYGGWGANLARIGAEASMQLTRPGGVLGMVLPISILADQASSRFRQHLLTESVLQDIGHFPAEARPFRRADVGACTLTMTRNRSLGIVEPRVTVYGKDFSATESASFRISNAEIAGRQYILPLGFGLAAAAISNSFDHLPRFGDLESKDEKGLWAGRELDETKISQQLGDTLGAPLFIKGRMIQRFDIVETPSQKVCKEGWVVPTSVGHERIVWRDVSRRNQKRRLIATIIPPGFVAGNSLGVAYLRQRDSRRLRTLLGLLSSLPFEIQLRSLLATGHVTLASLRMVHLPALNPSACWHDPLAHAVARRLDGQAEAEFEIEALSAAAYGLSLERFSQLISCFPKFNSDEREAMLSQFKLSKVRSA